MYFFKHFNPPSSDLCVPHSTVFAPVSSTSTLSRKRGLAPFPKFFKENFLGIEPFADEIRIKNKEMDSVCKKRIQNEYKTTGGITP